MRRFRLTAIILVGGAIGPFGAGCSGENRPNLIKVSGVVRYQGKPLSSGILTFVPDGEAGSAASSTIDGEGRYSLKSTRTWEGIAPGTYVVRVESWKQPPTDTQPGIYGIPLKYFRSRTSGLTVTVSEDTPEQVFDLDLN